MVFFTLLVIVGNASAIPMTSSPVTTKPVSHMKQAIKKRNGVVNDYATIDSVTVSTTVAHDDEEARVALDATIKTADMTEKVAEGEHSSIKQQAATLTEKTQEYSSVEDTSNSSKRSTSQRRGGMVPMKQVKVDELMRSLGLDTSSSVKDPRRRATDATIDADKKNNRRTTDDLADEKTKPILDDLQRLEDLIHSKRDKSSQSALTVEELLSELNRNKKRLDVSGISSHERLLDLLKNSAAKSTATTGTPRSGQRSGRGLRRVQLTKSLDASKVSAKEFDDYLRQMTSLKESKKRELGDELQSWWTTLSNRSKQLWMSNRRAPLSGSSATSKSASSSSTASTDNSPSSTRTTSGMEGGVDQSNTARISTTGGDAVAANNSTNPSSRQKSGTGNNKTTPMKPYTSRKTSSHVQLSKSAKTAAAVQDSTLPSTPRLNTIMLPELETNVKTTKS